MESPHHLVDSLTSHIALYHSSSPNPNPNPSPRSPILRHLSYLPSAARQSLLTFTDPAFVQILLQMRAHLASHGPTLFFLLPDLPSSSSSSAPAGATPLPSLCSRRARGLLARRQVSSHAVSDGLLLFGSRSEEVLDSVMVAEDLVVDIDVFVELMDGVSGGRFLRGEEAGLGEEWKEMGWLKDKGYYSLEEFVANRLEVALRRSWGACGGAGKKGKGKGGGAAGDSVFWRKKGCVDWWAELDPGRRKEFCLGFLGKAAKSLASEIVEGQNAVSSNKFGFLNVETTPPWNYGHVASGRRSKLPFLNSDSNICWDIIPCSGMPRHLVKLLNRLLVVREISTIILACQLNKVETETLFFSRLGSALTVSDCIMRKLRGLIMVVSIDYISRELLGDDNLKSLPNKTEEKRLNTACRKRKKKPRNSKQINSTPNSSRINSALPEPKMRNDLRVDCITDSSNKFCHQEDSSLIAANGKAETANTCVLPEDPGKVTTEHAPGVADCKGPADLKRNRGKGVKRKNSNSKKVVKTEIENKKTSVPLIAAESKLEESVNSSTLLPILSEISARDTLSPMSSSCNSQGPCIVDGDKMTDNGRICDCIPFADNSFTGPCYCSRPDKSEDVVIKCSSPSPAKDEKNPEITSPCSIINSDVDSCKQNDSSVSCSKITSVCDTTCIPFPTSDIGNRVMDNKHKLQNSGFVNSKTSQSIHPKLIHAAVNEQSVVSQNDGGEPYIHNHINSMGGTSHEWPRTTPLHLTSANLPHLPAAATDRLHLEVGHKQSNHFQQSFMQSRQQARNLSVDGGHGRILPSLTLPMSYDWPPVVKNCGRLNQTVTISYDSAFSPSLPASFSSGFAAHAARGMQINGASSENDRKLPGDIFDLYDLKTASEFPDDTESYWLSEEEAETHAFSGRDYNQFFGGGVMYWNPAEHVGTGFSRPPSHSSEDSSWAWYEADLNRAIDDMVGLPGLPASFNANGLASPPAAAFCSPFDPLGPGHQHIGYNTIPGNDGGKVLHSSSASDVAEERSSVSLNNSPGCVEGVKGDPLPYPMLRPIIVPSISRKGSRSEFKVNHDHKSPCLPSTRRDPPRIKRPPSPVVLCVPRVPRPPPPSPVGESRKRGFPIVRSGSSSPRHWGMRSYYHEDSNADDPRICLDGAEVVWPSWGTKGLAGTPVAQSIQGSLLQNHLIKISQLACDQEHPDLALPLQPPDLLNSPHKASLPMLHNLLHEEIDFFCKQVAADNLIKKPYINWAIKRVTRSLQVLWPRSRTTIFGSNATGLALPTSDVDLVVSLPPVRNLEPIKEAGILEGRNSIKETCLQHAARYLANQEWVRNDSLKTIENTAIPVIMLVAEIPQDINYSSANTSILEVQDAQPTNMPADSASHSDHSSSEDASLATCSKMRKDGGSGVKSIRLDISFKSPSHTGLQTSELVRELTQQFPASVPLALVLKKFLADRSLDHSYSGGLSSYCLVLMITRFLQHEHHVGRPINQNLGSLLMDFLYFFGNVFEPRQMRIFIQGSGVYMNRERGLSIDPIHIDDPLFPSNNVGRNCFRIHQCIKAFADAYSVLENELSQFSDDCGPRTTTAFEILQKIIPSIDREE